jgi:glucan endo-1,6-beta-glucosidase
MQNWASGAMAWTLGTDTNDGPHLSSGGCDTCEGLVLINTSAGTYSLTLNYYSMAQFSRYVSSGATALDTSGSWDYGSGQKLEAQAFVNPDGSRVLVVENGFDNDVYLTTSFQSGDEWSGPLYAQSVTTWVLPGN